MTALQFGGASSASGAVAAMLRLTVRRGSSRRLRRVPRYSPTGRCGEHSCSAPRFTTAPPSGVARHSDLLRLSARCQFSPRGDRGRLSLEGDGDHEPSEWLRVRSLRGVEDLSARNREEFDVASEFVVDRISAQSRVLVENSEKTPLRNRLAANRAIREREFDPCRVLGDERAQSAGQSFENHRGSQRYARR